MTSALLDEVTLDVRGYQLAAMLYVAAELALADRIENGARPVDELAAEANAEPGMLLRLCRALAAFGYFSIDGEGRLNQTERSAFLRRNATPTLHYASRALAGPDIWAAWGNLLHTVRTGESAFEATFGQPLFKYREAFPERREVFNAFMRTSPEDRHAAVAEAYDFSGVGTVVDVGGGTGALLRAILSVHEGVRGVLLDQQSVVANAAAVLGPLTARCDVVGGDFFEAVPAGGDVYTLAQILHDWNDERCRIILGNCRAAMKPGSRLLVIERVLEEGPDPAAPMNYLLDMHMAVLFPGAKERTPSEFAALFRDSGLRPPVVLPTRSIFRIVETGPAD